MTPRYYARSANDLTDDWRFWYVADRHKGGLNATAEVIRAHVNRKHAGAVFVSCERARALADMANGLNATPDVEGAPV